MNEKIIKVLISILTVGLIVCAVFLYRQHTQLIALQGQLSVQEEQLERISKALKISQARLESSMIRILPSGVYRLSAEVIVDPYQAEKDEYTIYNFVLDIDVGGVRRKLQFGYGHSGFLTHVIYFDHDSDGKIDLKMMNDYVKEIPIPGVESVADMFIDPVRSQAVYDAFRLNVDSAEQLSMDGVTNSTNATIDVMWGWLKEQSEGLSEWVEEAIEFD